MSALEIPASSCFKLESAKNKRGSSMLYPEEIILYGTFHPLNANYNKMKELVLEHHCDALFKEDRDNSVSSSDWSRNPTVLWALKILYFLGTHLFSKENDSASINKLQRELSLPLYPIDIPTKDLLRRIGLLFVILDWICLFTIVAGSLLLLYNGLFLQALFFALVIPISYFGALLILVLNGEREKYMTKRIAEISSKERYRSVFVGVGRCHTDGIEKKIERLCPQSRIIKSNEIF